MRCLPTVAAVATCVLLAACGDAKPATAADQAIALLPRMMDFTDALSKSAESAKGDCAVIAETLRTSIDREPALVADIKTLSGLVPQKILEADEHRALQARFYESGERFRNVVVDPCGSQPAVATQLERVFGKPTETP